MSAIVLMLLASTSVPDLVVVFPDRAQVTRTTTVTCGPRVPVSFEGIPPAAAQDSFRSRVVGGSIDGMRAELVSREKEFSEKAVALRTQLDALLIDIENVSDSLSRAQAQQRAGQKYTDIAVQLVSKELADKPDVKSWSLAFDSSLSTGLAAAKQTAELKARLRALRLKDEELRRQFSEVQLASSKKSWTVEVLASCPNGKTAELALTYLVGGASWTPEYEARALETESAVEFSTWATIHQGTGEDWSQVELVLSTAVPSQNATPPELKVLQLSAWEKGPEKKVLVRREEYVEHAQVSTGSLAGGLGGQVVAREQGLSVQLAVPDKSKVPGDGAPVRLFVGKSRMKAAFEVRTAPRAMPVAFRVAELNNQGSWPLLPGRVDAFRSTGLVGRYSIDRVPQGGAFTLTFGIEDAVRVKRNIVDELKRDTGLFNGNKRFTYVYSFDVANYGKQPLTVTLAEQLPVSELSDVAVSVGEKTSPGYKLDAKDGIAKWAVTLKPGEKKKLDLDFRVDVPNSYDTGGL